jgi:hypothetical protein
MESIAFGDNAAVTATVDGCSYNFTAEIRWPGLRWHFADSTPCSNASRRDIAFRTFVYAIYRPSGYASVDPNQFVVVICQPLRSITKVSPTAFVAQGAIGALVVPPVVIDLFPVGGNTTDRTLPNCLDHR